MATRVAVSTERDNISDSEYYKHCWEVYKLHKSPVYLCSSNFYDWFINLFDDCTPFKLTLIQKTETTSKLILKLPSFGLNAMELSYINRNFITINKLTQTFPKGKLIY